MIRVGLEVKALAGHGSAVQSTPEIIHRRNTHRQGQDAIKDQAASHENCQGKNALWYNS